MLSAGDEICRASKLLMRHQYELVLAVRSSFAPEQVVCPAFLLTAQLSSARGLLHSQEAALGAKDGFPDRCILRLLHAPWIRLRSGRNMGRCHTNWNESLTAKSVAVALMAGSAPRYCTNESNGS